MFQEKMEIKNMRNGVGSVLIEKFYPQPINCKMYARITILPNSSIGEHIHLDDEEIVYVLKGTGIAHVGDETLAITTGSVHLVNQGMKHQIINNSHENLVILAVINE